MMADSAKRYRKHIKSRLIKHREEHLDEINNKSSYKTITVHDKDNKNNKDHKDGHDSKDHKNAKDQKQDAPVSGLKNNRGENDLNSILKKRIEGIQEEMT